MSVDVRTLHAETSHALRIAGCKGDLCCLEQEIFVAPSHPTPSKMDAPDPYNQKREEQP